MLVAVQSLSRLLAAGSTCVTVLSASGAICHIARFTLCSRSKDKVGALLQLFCMRDGVPDHLSFPPMPGRLVRVLAPQVASARSRAPFCCGLECCWIVCCSITGQEGAVAGPKRSQGVLAECVGWQPEDSGNPAAAAWHPQQLIDWGAGAIRWHAVPRSYAV